MNSYLKAHDGFQGDILFYKAVECLGFTYEGFATTSGHIKNAMNEGKFAILNVLHRRHWVLATGFIDGGYTVMDPGNVTKTYNYNDVVKSVIYSIPSRSVSNMNGQPVYTQSQQSPAVESTPNTESQATTSQNPTTSPSSSQQSTDSSTPSSIISESIDAHNKYRAPLGIPDLTWSSSLAMSAQAWADQLASSHGTSHSSSRINVGENISWGTANSNDVTALIDLWGSEKEDFVPGMDYPDCSSTGSQSSVWHYTQMIWRTTTQVGCGVGTDNGKIYLVCQYSPAGNIRGQLVY